MVWGCSASCLCAKPGSPCRCGCAGANHGAICAFKAKARILRGLKAQKEKPVGKEVLRSGHR